MEKGTSVLDRINEVQAKVVRLERMYVTLRHRTYDVLAIIRKLTEDFTENDLQASLGEEPRKTDDPAMVATKIAFQKATDKEFRKRISVYAKVVRIAIANEISSDEMVGWIKENGGIEKIRNVKSESEGSSDEQEYTKDGVRVKMTAADVDAAFDNLKANGKSGFVIEKDAMPADLPMKGDEFALMVKATSSGDFAIMFVTQSEAVMQPMNLALKAAMVSDAVSEVSKVVAKTANDNNAEVDEAIADATKTVENIDAA
ncbi:hypothetical protein WMC41_14865 [Shinella yambaruensis]|uniref:hypothetical protein n=1 Tax=Shinella yambaruensis TaxID=415996 RepID=UPI003D7A9890